MKAQDANNKSIVGLARGQAIGFMAMTSIIDSNLLSRYFKLDYYENLFAPQQADNGECFSAQICHDEDEAF